MTLVDEIKAKIDIVEYVQTYISLKPRGQYFHALCPFHHERTPSFVVNSRRQFWQCFGACVTGGDVISFAMRYHNWDFVTAKRELALFARIDLSTPSSFPIRPPAANPLPMHDQLSIPPSKEWQSHAELVVGEAEHTLWSTTGAPALRYLRGRGLEDNTIHAARLGYVPFQSDQERQYGIRVLPNWTVDGTAVRVFPGITLPHYADGHLWGIRIRTSSGKPKYIGVRGGSKALYGADAVIPSHPLLITEGEFDCLLARQVACKRALQLSVVSLASASNKSINRRWWPKLLGAPTLLVRVDADMAGQAALKCLQTLSACMCEVAVPQCKDINDFYLKVGEAEFQCWLASLLAGKPFSDTL